MENKNSNKIPKYYDTFCPQCNRIVKSIFMRVICFRCQSIIDMNRAMGDLTEYHETKKDTKETE